MSSPCLSGGGRAYGLEFEILKCSSITSSRTSHASSPSSTLSEAGNSPLTISTRKPRTSRKRPNQTYNEAAAILSTAYPSIFSNNNQLSCSRKFTTPPDIILQPSELLLPFRVFDNSGFLIQQPMRERTYEAKVTTPTSCDKSWVSNESSMDDELEAESIIYEDIKEGIDSIMGNNAWSAGGGNYNIGCGEISRSTWYGYPMGYNFGIGFSKAFRPVDQGNFPIVDVFQISPRLTTANKNASNPIPNSPSKPKLSSGNKKKKKKVEKPLQELNKVVKSSVDEEEEGSEEEEEEENLVNLKSKETAALQLKLNYEEILSAWSDRGSPFSDGNDVSARQTQLDMIREGEGGIREASVLRYKEKRRTRLFSKKIRYQVRKVNADRRPRMKGRFVRRPNSSK